MGKPIKRTYRKGGLEFGNLVFKSQGERKYVKVHVENIVQRLKELRKSKGVSQEALAEMVSSSVSTIKFIEQGQRSPSLAMYFKILYALDKNTSL